MSSHYINIDQRVELINEFIDSISLNNYYVFLGKHSSNTTAEEIQTTVKEADYDVYRNMISGKKVTSNDIYPVIRYIPYVTNKQYDIYDHEDTDLFTKDFYATVLEGSNYHTYKCLFNNSANSTVQPQIAHISGANAELYQTSDGYIWKYLYSMDKTIADNFKTSTIFPLTTNSAVMAAAKPGSIDVIIVDDGGERYDNYLSGTFLGAEVKINGNSSVHEISATGASTINGFYTGCMLYISGGDGIGDHRVIEDHYSNSTGIYITLEDDLETISNGSEYMINPQIKVVGGGRQSVNVVAIGLVNSLATNGIHKVMVLDSGRNYRYVTANVVANNIVGVTKQAVLRPILSPNLGHGFDPIKELDVKGVNIVTAFSNNEANTIPDTNNFKQVGLLKNPLFANVHFNFSSPSGTMEEGEILYNVRPIKIGNCIANSATANLTVSLADYGNNLANGTQIYIKSNNNDFFMFTSINSVTNSTQVILNDIPSQSQSNCSIYLANSNANAFISNVGTQYSVFVSNCASQFQIGDIVVSKDSGVSATINAISRNDVTKQFNTFIQMYKYVCSPVSGSFTVNERVYQNTINTSNALLFSVSSNGSIMYTTNQVGIFLAGGTNTIIGSNSNAISYISEQFYPELELDGGNVLYIENIDSIERANDQTESIAFFLQF